MFFLRFIVSLLAVGTITALASPTGPPPAKKKNDVSDVLRIIDHLQHKANIILPQIDNLVNTKTANEKNLTPLLKHLVSEFDNGSASLKKLEGNVNPRAGGTKEEVAKKTASVYTDVARSFNNLLKKEPKLYGLVPKYGVGLTLLRFLFNLNLVVGGVLKIVAILLKTIADLLKGLGFTLIGVLLQIL
ncbi:hypothetical protein CVT24_001101 [Panaeolus cyanescens]|uniref:Uncharacterized protein n=1 Tax=Panaeolus cyanescens TaxID=181874 RepID=A0A409YTE2_9AGAR|nr:hypothetical protein CVT24_001101 [Panaeolus cyanescens]